MAFTSLSTIRKHLIVSNTPSQSVQNIPITLVGTTEVSLPHDNLIADSELVKRLASDIPTFDSGVLLVDEDEVSLSQKFLAHNSVVVASDLALTTIFSEEIDYRVNHDAGQISRRVTGAIPNSLPAVVWYNFYKQYSAGSDYVLNADQGLIRRTSGSTISDGETLRIDYSVSQASTENALIEQAIIEAEDIIVRALREGYNSSSTDQGLKTGATHLALSIVARGMAAFALSRNTGGDANSRAREWQQLSEKWHSTAWTVLAPYINPHLMRSIVIE